MKKITIQNTFHGTTVKVVARDNGDISARQAKHIAKVLCGIEGCSCGKNGIRDHRVGIDFYADGSAQLCGMGV